MDSAALLPLFCTPLIKSSYSLSYFTAFPVVLISASIQEHAPGVEGASQLVRMVYVKASAGHHGLGCFDLGPSVPSAGLDVYKHAKQCVHTRDGCWLQAA